MTASAPSPAAAPATLRNRLPRRQNLALHLAGLTLLFLAPGMAVSAAVEFGAGGDEVAALLVSALIVAGLGGLVWATTEVPSRLTTTVTLVSVAGTWITAAVFGALPFILADTFPTWDNALFESVSGFTGTGSTVLSPIEGTSRGILFWRSLSQWYGGMGMVVLAVAVLPFLGVGGMGLLSAESPGPSSDRLAPRVSATAVRLWGVYAGFTVLSVVALLASGLSLYDAVVHAFTVVSTGGLSTYDDSIGHFDSVQVEMVVAGLMLIGGTSFTLHWRAVTGHPGAYWRSPLFRWYVAIFVTATVVITALLLSDGSGLGASVRSAVFNVATLLTSTGYGTDDFVTWLPAAQLVLLGLMVSGGMAGSTAGGVKLVRVRLVEAAARRELRRVRHPRAVLPIRIGSTPTPEGIVARVIGYVALWVLIVITGTVVLALLGTDLVTSSSAAVSVMSNMGPALGEAGPASNFLVFTRPARGLLMVMMVAGRLEILPVVVLLARIVDPVTRTTRQVEGRIRR